MRKEGLLSLIFSNGISYWLKAFELGINFFDTPNVYAEGTSEEIVGRALKDFAKRD